MDSFHIDHTDPIKIREVIGRPGGVARIKDKASRKFWWDFHQLGDAEMVDRVLDALLDSNSPGHTRGFRHVTMCMRVIKHRPLKQEEREDLACTFHTALEHQARGIMSEALNQAKKSGRAGGKNSMRRKCRGTRPTKHRA